MSATQPPTALDLDVWDGVTPASAVSHGPDWDAAVADGLDMSLIELSLATTPGQRAERLQSLLHQMAALRASRAVASEASGHKRDSLVPAEGMGSQRTDVRLQSLRAAEVEFLVIGGVAAVLHGSSYVSFELTVLARPTPTMRLVLALGDP